MEAKVKIQIVDDAKQYPELTYEQVKELVRLLRKGKTEKEALEMIANE